MATANDITTLNHLFFHHVERHRHGCLLSWERPGGVRVSYSTEQFAGSVLALRAHLAACGLQGSGERVAIFSENRPEWHIADFAILLAGHIVVPVYDTLAPGQVQYLLEHSGCRAAVIGGGRQWKILKPMLSRLPKLEWIISMDDEPGDADRVNMVSWRAIQEGGPEFEPVSLERVRAACLAVDPASIATIVYTSGTTAQPKGVMLSHANLVFDLERCLERLAFRTVPQALSVLPLAHVFERLLCYGYFRMGVPIAYGDPHDLRDLLRRYRPEVMGCVPRVLEKIRDAIEAQIELQVPWRRRIARSLLGSASRRLARGNGSSGGLFHRLLAARIRGQLGGLRYFICGGAWLDPAVELFIRGAGLVVLQGYGLTETSPVISLNALGHEKTGSVGRPLDRIEVRIGERGEIQTRGPHVMAGYYGDPEATRNAIRDGWLMTGDLGSLDAGGFLSITGRSKEMLLLSNGKNVYYAAIEKALSRSRLIQECFVVGEGRKFVSALVVPNMENLARAAGAAGLQNPEELLVSPGVLALFRQEIETQQSEFSNFERVKSFCFLTEDALLDPELMTPTLKMRRNVLERKYAQWIGEMYVRQEPFVITRAEKTVPV